ncbi:hypothetical protein BDP67DRAFT_499838 [Colletotrichum lupini]|nr:hypothetical protein BDP67DRAFT_499838 [Colletotrichum lupini]
MHNNPQTRRQHQHSKSPQKQRRQQHHNHDPAASPPARKASLHDRIDAAVDEAREFLWARAVDPEGPTEEVNLFYGSLSTALTFPKGPKRTHLLTQQPPSPNQPLSPPTNTNTTTTPQNPSTPSPPSSSTPTTPPTAGSVTTAPHPGSAYLHAVAARDTPRMIFYNDT